MPHDVTAFIHIPIGVTDDLAVGPQLKPIEHNPRRLSHRASHDGDVVAESINRCANQKRVMHWCANLNAALGT